MAEECIDVRAIDAAVEIYIRTGFGLWLVVESAARVIAIPDAVEKLGFVTLNREDPFTKRRMQSGLGASELELSTPKLRGRTGEVVERASERTRCSFQAVDAPIFKIGGKELIVNNVETNITQAKAAVERSFLNWFGSRPSRWDQCNERAMMSRLSAPSPRPATRSNRREG